MALVLYFGWALFFMNVAAQKNEKAEGFFKTLFFIAVAFLFLGLAYGELKKNFCIP
jgi:hypothetical protein